MNSLILLLCSIASICTARAAVVPQNVVTVPPNCPEGQEWINGQCREVWRVTAAPTNIVTVPTNCPPGQIFVNGMCRDVWFKNIGVEDIPPENEHFEIVPQNVVTVPPNCRPGQQWVNGLCKDVWRSGAAQLENSKNVITVPTNCAPGEVFINGQCREVWRSSLNQIESYVSSLRNVLISRQVRQVENVEESQDQDRSYKNVIGVPSQCPAGFRPDALGICREILF